MGAANSQGSSASLHVQEQTVYRKHYFPFNLVVNLTLFLKNSLCMYTHTHPWSKKMLSSLDSPTWWPVDFSHSDKSHKTMCQHREANHSLISMRSSVKILANTEECKPSNVFSTTKAVISLLPYDHRHSQSHEVPVTLHTGELYVQEKGMSEALYHKNNLLLSLSVTQVSFP